MNARHNARTRTTTLLASIALFAVLAAASPLAAGQGASQALAETPVETLTLDAATTALANELQIQLGGSQPATCTVEKTCLNPAAYCQCVARLGDERVCYTMTCAE